MKTAIVIMSDPKTGSDESIGRVANALVTAIDCKENGDEVAVIFQGAGSRWPGILKDEAHPLHGFFAAAKDLIVGISKGCAAHFEADADGFELLCDAEIPGTPGFTSFRKYLADGYQVLVF